MSRFSPLVNSQARTILRELRASNEPVEMAAWVSYDGFVLASLTDAEVNADRVGAMCASLLALSRRAASEVDVGDLYQIILGGSRGVMLLLEAGPGYALAFSAASGANLGRLLLLARQTASKLEHLAVTQLRDGAKS